MTHFGEKKDLPFGHTKVSRCPDGHECHNGSMCTKQKERPGSYYCDCNWIYTKSVDAVEAAATEAGKEAAKEAAESLSSSSQQQPYEGGGDPESWWTANSTRPSPGSGSQIYAGFHCEHEATEFCNERGDISRTSFCTNGGTCIFQVDVRGVHRGCKCTDEFTGPFCQFRTDQDIPEDWPRGPPYTPFQAGEEEGGDGLVVDDDGGDAVVAVATAAAVLFVVAFASVLLYYRRGLARRRAGGSGGRRGNDGAKDLPPPPPIAPSFSDDAGDLRLDADGAVLKEAVMDRMQQDEEEGGVGRRQARQLDEGVDGDDDGDEQEESEEDSRRGDGSDSSREVGII